MVKQYRMENEKLLNLLGKNFYFNGCMMHAIKLNKIYLYVKKYRIHKKLKFDTNITYLSCNNSTEYKHYYNDLEEKEEKIKITSLMECLINIIYENNVWDIYIKDKNNDGFHKTTIYDNYDKTFNEMYIDDKETIKNLIDNIVYLDDKHKLDIKKSHMNILYTKYISSLKTYEILDIINKENTKFNYKEKYELYKKEYDKIISQNKKVELFLRTHENVNDDCPVCLLNNGFVYKHYYDCSHHICVNCFNSWKPQGGRTCPQCRAKAK